MKLFRKIARLFFATSVGLAIGTSITISAYTKSYKPYKWSSSPIIANCYGPDFYEDRIKSAVRYWNDNDEEAAFIIVDPPESVCRHEYLDGFIILKKAPRGYLSDETLAKTKTKIKTLKLKAAVIYFNPGTQNLSYVVEHELGHAFGYKHIDKPGHIMHSNYDYMGPKFWIPK